jgi:peptidoglycan/xylan/chitin deacetylase (PgdA/CDA1 family)
MKRCVQYVLVLFLVSLFAGPLFAQHTVAYWPDNKPGMVSLSFDDGLPSHLSLIIPTLNAYGMKGTFYLITDYANSENTWAAWRAAAAQGHEIGSHTLSHPSLPTLTSSQLNAELQQSKTIIETQIPSQKCLTLAYPFGDTSSTVQAATKNYYIAGRGIQYDINYPTYDFYNLKSRGDDPGSTLSAMKDATDTTQAWGEWLTLYLHSMNGDGYGTWDMNIFTAYLDYLKTKNLGIDTIANVVKYIRERDSAKLSLVSSSSSQIVLSLTDSMDNTIYSFPLTLRSEVPSGWANVNVVQGSNTSSVASVVESGTRVAYYDAVPDGGQIILTGSTTQVGITGINPTSVLAGSSAFTLQVTGVNFVSGSTVRWNGSGRTTTYISATQLQAAISASDIATQGVASVTVSNPDGTVSGALSFQINGIQISSIAVSPTSVRGGTTSQGTVTLSAAAPSSGATVTLSSSNAAAPVPSSVTVNAGNTSTTFTITTMAVSASTSATITASYSGASKTATLTVTPPALSTLTLNPTTVTGGATSQGTVMLDAPAPSSGAVVTLTSSRTTAATVPSSVTVAAGSTTATFTVTSKAVTASTASTITARYSSVSKTARLTVTPGTVLSSVSLNPASVIGGNSSQGTVVLSGAAPSSGAMVTLSSNNASASVPSSVTVAAGSTSATFTVTTVGVSALASATITAGYSGSSKTASLTVTPPSALNSVSLNPTSVTGGTSAQGTVALSGAAPSGGAVVTLSSNSASASVPSSVTIAAGSTSATFTVTTVSVSASTPVTIMASYNGTSKTAALTVTSSSTLSVLPTTSWSLNYVDSQETAAEDGRAVNAFDGNPATFWHTQWSSSSPATPHEIQIDLGASYNIGGFRYLPRQDGEVNGTIAKYEFYVSQDGTTWGSAVATGTFAGNASEKEVTFSGVNARYVRLRAVTEVNGNPWTSVAELKVLAFN